MKIRKCIDLLKQVKTVDKDDLGKISTVIDELEAEILKVKQSQLATLKKNLGELFNN